MRKSIEKYTTTYFFIALVAIFLFGFSSIFRIFNLDRLPSGFFGDEAALVYNGWSLLETGRDEWGDFLPLTLRSFDDYKPAVYAYFTIPFILLFGLSYEAARFPAALAGALLPALVFLLLYDASSRKKQVVAFITGLVIAITPWHWEVSRTAIESGVALTLSVAAFVCLKRFPLELYSQVHKKGKAFFSKRFLYEFGLLVLVSTLLFLVLYTYHTARVIVPSLVIVGLLSGFFARSKEHILIAAVFTFFGLYLAITASGARYQQISLFADPSVGAKQQESIFRAGQSGVSILETRMYHNKLWSWVYTYGKSYIKNSSLEYLFIGGAQPIRASIPETGQFLLFFLPFFLFGLAWSIRTIDSTTTWLFAWFFIAPALASLTTAEIPHVYRTLFLLIPVAYFIAQGLAAGFFGAQYVLVYLLDQLKLQSKNYSVGTISKILLVAYICVLLPGLVWSVGKAWHQYSVQQALNQPWYRQYGYVELFTYLSERFEDDDNSSRVELATITTSQMEPYIFYLFHNKIHPAEYQLLENKRLAHVDIEAGDRSWQLHNLVFSEEKCPFDELDFDTKHVYVVSLNCDMPAHYELETDIVFEDGVPMFHVFRPRSIERTKAEVLKKLNDTQIKYLESIL